MEEHVTDNAGMGANGPNDGRGRLIAPIASAQRSEARFNPSARLSQRDVSPQSLESMSEEEFWNLVHERAKSISGIPIEREDRSHQYLECSLSCGTFFMPLHALGEVLPAPRHFALLPNIPGWMLGIMVWRGQAIAVVDLDAYLCDTTSRAGISTSDGILLVASDVHHADLTVGLFVHLVGMIDNQVYDKHNIPSSPIIDMPVLLADVARQIGIAAHHG